VHHRLIILSLLLSIVGTQSAPRKKPTGSPQGPMKPLASALHVLEPLSIASGNQQSQQPNDVRTFELSINDYVTVSINGGIGGSNILAAFTTGAGHGPSVITLQNYTYHVNWQPERNQVGTGYSIVFAVAGLRLNAVAYLAADRRDLPIKFFIESHPRIRARVMHVQGYGASDIARQLKSEYQSPGTDVAFILFDEKFPALEIGAALHDVYSATPQQAANWLRVAGMGAVDIGQILKVIYTLSAIETATVLRLAGFDADQVYLSLKQVYQLVREDAEDVLVAAGFTKDEAFKAILPDLLTWYDGLIHHYGPTVYEHPAEPFKMSGVEWFLDRVSLRYEAEGQTFTYQNATNPVTTANLGTIAEELKAAGATNLWLGTIPQFSDALKAGDQPTARARVHVVRLRDTGYTDFQFWLWYPYNGPGTLHARATIATFYDSTTWEVGQDPSDYGNAHPLGEHYSDWENIVLRTDTKTGALIGAFMSEHGDYVPFLVATNGLLQDSNGRVQAFASLNGHANYAAPGNNPNIVKSGGYDQLKGFFSFELLAELLNYTDYSPTSLNASSNYVIEGVDQYYIDGSRQVASNSWIAFDGAWGPVHPLNLTDSEKLTIVMNIAGDAIKQVRLDIPKLAAEGCSVVAAPCAAIFGFGYAGCFAGCMAGLVTGAEVAINPLLDKYGPSIVDNFPTDDQVLDGKPSPGVKRRGTEWQYMRYPSEQPPLVNVVEPPDQIAGVVPIMINIATGLIRPVTNSYNVTVAKAELSINGTYIDVTASSTNGGYVYYWDTSTVPDGNYELHARLTGTDGKFYEYSWDRPEVEVANSALIFNALVLSSKSIIEGGSVSVNSSFYSSQTNQNFSVSVSWGDGPAESFTLSPSARAFSRTHTYLQDSPVGYSIQATLSDGVTNAVRSAQLQVANATPAINSLTSGQGLLPLSPTTASASFAATFSDPGTLDSHAATWSLGDGTTNTQANATSPLTEFHNYTAAGVYGVNLAVSDSGNAITQSNLSNYLTVYDPAGAYFAGSGSIIAPVPTADTNNALVQAPFGFVLQPGSGTFGLRFKLSDTEFFSSHYTQWQENAAHNGGRITGTGTLNGANFTNGLPYNFVLTATLNTFQIQIATPLTNSVPYETQTNQPLADGFIIIK
jgi:hypothetical protein